MSGQQQFGPGKADKSRIRAQRAVTWTTCKNRWKRASVQFRATCDSVAHKLLSQCVGFNKREASKCLGNTGVITCSSVTSGLQQFMLGLIRLEALLKAQPDTSKKNCFVRSGHIDYALLRDKLDKFNGHLRHLGSGLIDTHQISKFSAHGLRNGHTRSFCV